MTNNIKENIEDYISKNYDKLLLSAKFITRNDTAGDLLNDVCIYILTLKSYSIKLQRCTNFYNYIVRAMVVQHFSNNSEYHKQYRRENLDIFDDEEDKNVEYDYTYEEIVKYVNRCLSRKTEKNFWYRKVFYDYFVGDGEQMSMGDISEKYNISKSSVRNCIVEIKNKIERRYGK